MKTYKITFMSCKLGAIGKPQNYSLTIKANNFAEANLKMYDTHEHIRIKTVNGKFDKDNDYNKFD